MSRSAVNGCGTSSPCCCNAGGGQSRPRFCSTWSGRSGRGTLTVAAVHTVVARLRRQLGADSITSQDAGYLLDARVSTDEDTFVDLVGRARGLLVTGEPAAAAKRYREALRCWHGDEAFEDVRSDLVDTDRARLAELRATAIEELADLLLTDPHIGDPAAAYLLGSWADRSTTVARKGLSADDGGRRPMPPPG